MIDALPLLLSDEGYQISRSVRLRSSASAYFNRTNSGSPTNAIKWTWSGWFKRGVLPSTSNLFTATNSGNDDSYLQFSNDNLIFGSYQGAGTDYGIKTAAVFRDPSAWYHIVAVLDTANATAADRAILYINGVRQTVNNQSNGTFPQNYTGCKINTASQAVRMGLRGVFNDGPLDGYLTEINFIDGQALTPASFGETNPVTGVWQPKKYTGTYGTNGFFLNFSDNSAATAAAIGKDNSGNGNNWTPNNISVTAGATYDSMLDVPTQWADGGNGRGNYAVLNPLDFTTVGTISEANLRFAQSSLFSRSGRATIGVASGKWYWEVTNLGGNNSIGIGNASMSLGGYCGQDANGWSYFIDGDKYNNSTATAYGASYTTNDVIGVALDMDAGTLTFYKNGVSQGQAFSSLSGTMFPAFSASSVSNVTFVANFGQRPFAFSPPTGFKALNTLNLPTPTILKGNQYFDVVTRNGSSGPYTTTIDLTQGAMLWDKTRSAVGNHNLVDSVRGISKLIQSNNTNAEATDATFITAFNNKSYTTGAGDYGSGTTLVDWIWQKGATQGFDIVTYTGDGTNNRTVSHSLGVTPSMVIVKSRTSGTRSWFVAHRSLATNNNLLLQTTDIAYGPSAFGSGVVGNLTSSVFECVPGTIAPNNTANINANGENFIAYLFASVAGYSAFGSYTGNGSADGTFVFTGFRPRFVMTKRTDTTSPWQVLDSSRDTYNSAIAGLFPNTSGAEASFTQPNGIDYLSNGFKLRNSSTDDNASGGTYIYAAFAENPFKNALAR
jgi:hypothetical protein